MRAAEIWLCYSAYILLQSIFPSLLKPEHAKRSQSGRMRSWSWAQFSSHF